LRTAEFTKVIWDAIITDQWLITLSDGITKRPDTAQFPLHAFTMRMTTSAFPDRA
jgi:hypothetical protein